MEKIYRILLGIFLVCLIPILFGPELLVLSVFLLRNGGLQHQKSPDKRQYLEAYFHFPVGIRHRLRRR